MTKAEQIIEKLGGIRKIDELAWEVYPISIGEVLDQMMSTDTAPQTDGELVELWRACGFTKSLQEIAGDIEKGELGERVGDCPDGCKKNHQHGKFRTHGLVSLQASALIEFLHSIFITE